MNIDNTVKFCCGKEVRIVSGMVIGLLNTKIHAYIHTFIHIYIHVCIHTYKEQVRALD